MKRSYVLFTLVFLCLCLCACGSTGATEASEAAVEPTYSQEELAYNDTMAAYLNTVDASQITGNKAVVCILNEDDSDCFYTSRYLPEELIAESPEEVRYIINCYETVIKVGWYTNGAQGYKYNLNAYLADVKYDIPVAYDILCVASIAGGEPPKEVSEQGDYYGSRPSFETLGAAVTEAIVEKIVKYEEWLSTKLCANCGICLEDRYVCCPECGTFR